MTSKRLLALVLAALMVMALFAGCGQADTPAADEPVADAPAADAPAADAPAADEPAADEPAEPLPGEVFTNEDGELEYMLPLTEEEEIITVWAPMTQQFQNYLESYDQIDGVVRLMADTGVTLEFTSPASDQKTTQFMTMIAGGEYPDVLDGVNDLYSTGLTGACDEGVILDLTELQAESAPCYTAMVKELGAEKDLVDDSGRSYLFAMLHNDGTQLTTGLAARKDWMDELGIEKLETYDEWYEYLKGIKTNHNATMWATQNGQLSYNYLSAGFGTQMFVFANPGSVAPYIVEDGVVNWGPMKKDAAVEYLTMMNQWWNEGLIYEDFLSVFAPFTADVTPLTNNSVGLAVIIGAQFTALNQAGLVDEGFELWPVHDPVKEAGTTHTYSTANPLYSLTGYSISVNCENVDLCVKFLDYLYSRKGYETLMYGVEGEHFNYDENGEPHYTDYILNNPDEPYDAMQNKIFSMNSFRGATAYAAVLNAYGPAQTEALTIWRTHSADNTYPTSATMTADESSEHALKYAEVQTYAATALTEFIIGERDISEYDEFIQTCIDLGIEECIAIKQAAYDRYIAR